MRTFKTTAAVLALLVATAAANPALALETSPAAKVDANLVAAARLLKHVQANRMVTSDGLRKLAQMLAYLAVQRNHMVNGDAGLAKRIVEVKRAVQVHNGMVRELERRRPDLTPRQIARVEAVIAKLRNDIRSAQTDLRGRIQLRTKAYAWLIAKTQVFVDELQKFVAAQGNRIVA